MQPLSLSAPGSPQQQQAQSQRRQSVSSLLGSPPTASLAASPAIRAAIAQQRLAEPQLLSLDGSPILEPQPAPQQQVPLEDEQRASKSREEDRELRKLKREAEMDKYENTIDDYAELSTYHRLWICPLLLVLTHAFCVCLCSGAVWLRDSLCVCLPAGGSAGHCDELYRSPYRLVQACLCASAAAPGNSIQHRYDSFNHEKISSVFL